MTYLTDFAGGPVYTCVHGGTFTITGSALVEEGDPSTLYAFQFATIAASAPCPATVPTLGVPPCVAVLATLASSVFKADGAAPAIMGFDIQISTSNGLPLIAFAGISVNAVGL